MPASNKKRDLTGLKLVLAPVPLLPESHDELRVYGDELARYANGEAAIDQAARTGTGKRLLDRSEGAAQMLRRWLGTLPSPPPAVLKAIAEATQSINLGRVDIVTPIKGRKIDLTARFELDLPNEVAGMAFMLTSLLAAGYGENLRRCANDRCGIWYFDIPSGRPLKLYCTPKCSNRARQRRSTAKAKGIRK